MMTISLNKNAIQQNGLTVDEALLLLSIHNNVDFNSAKQSLVSKGFITAQLNAEMKPIGWRVTNKGIQILDDTIIDSDKYQEPIEKLESLAQSLKNLFPKGKKDGTNYYWADGVALIVRRLKLFFKKYGNTYSNEQIIKATEKYVKSFNGNYKFMKLLKYFIFKEKIGAGGDIEGESDLITYIENCNEDIIINNDWEVTLK